VFGGLEAGGDAMRSRKVGLLATGLLTLSPFIVGISRASETAEARPGDKIRITASQREGTPGQSLAEQQQTILGTLLELDKNTITVLRKAEQDRIRIQRSAIQKLEVGRGTTRGRNALIGAGVGAVIGLGWALVEHSRCKGEWLCGVEFALPLLTTPAGSLIGLATGKQRWIEARPMPSAASVLPARRGIRVAWSFTF
jgi:hypothetical protein